MWVIPLVGDSQLVACRLGDLARNYVRYLLRDSNIPLLVVTVRANCIIIFSSSLDALRLTYVNRVSKGVRTKLETRTIPQLLLKD